ncbi:MAG: transcription factor S [bacterium]|nr:transcription factor S [bacterium]
MFCPKCGNLLKKEGNELVCPKCGYRESLSNGTETISFKEERTTVFFTENRQKFPVVKVQCPKCGNEEAYVMVQQTRSADEAPTRIFKCTRCGYVWREYD